MLNNNTLAYYSISHGREVQSCLVSGNREQGTGNREQGTGNREHGMANATLSLSTSLTDHTKNNQIQSPPLTRGGLGWGETIVDTLIMT